MKKIFDGLLLWALVLSIVLSSNPVAQAEEITTVPNRISGVDRYQTAKAISQEFNGGICNNVILASGITFPDALAASVLSKKLNAPIILADVSVSGSAQAMEYIYTHVQSGGTIYIIGGTAVVGTDMEATLKAKGYINIVRLAGQSPYDTDMAVVNEVNVPQGTPVFIASGENFPDALSVSSFAGSKQYPILLVGTNVLPEKTNAYLVSNKPSTVYIAGGTSVVSQAVENQIKEATPNATIKRLAGNDRYDTAGVVVKEFASTPNTIYLANGLNFPDALAGSALAARTGEPILLVDNASSTMPPAIGAYLQQLRDAGIRPNVRALGGSVAVPEILIQQSEAILDGKPPVTPEPKGFKNPEFANSSQVFLVTASSTSTSYGTGSMYGKVNGQWVNLSSFPVRLGSNGMSYTRVQNSEKTPAGILNILSAFGIADNPGSNYSYHKVSTTDYWNLNDGSSTYNRLVDGDPGGDAEHLIDYLEQYKYALVTDWNYLQSTGLGGAIFIHINGPGATGSCISLTEGNMLSLLRWMNPSNNPKVLVVPNSDLSNYFY